MAILKKINIELLYDPPLPLLCVCIPKTIDSRASNRYLYAHGPQQSKFPYSQSPRESHFLRACFEARRRQDFFLHGLAGLALTDPLIALTEPPGWFRLIATEERESN